ncbi:hypothetical protein D3261_16185 [Halococcus sp. IIIV-5B]|nr:hypothetical protein D3261_16185 [Halococcus sp. IIIV-5B]
MINLTKSLPVEYGEDDIPVNSISPSLTRRGSPCGTSNRT